MQRGLDIHKLAEDYIKGSIARLPKELKNFEALFKQLKAQFKKKVHGMTIEETWAFTKDWGLTVWNDWAARAAIQTMNEMLGVTDGDKKERKTYNVTLSVKDASEDAE